MIIIPIVYLTNKDYYNKITSFIRGNEKVLERLTKESYQNNALTLYKLYLEDNELNAIVYEIANNLFVEVHNHNTKLTYTDTCSIIKYYLIFNKLKATPLFEEHFNKKLKRR